MSKIPEVEVFVLSTHSPPVKDSKTPLHFQVIGSAAVGAESASEVGGIPKWVLGLAIGVPVAAALAYIIFGPSSSDEGDKKKTKKAANKKTTPAKPSPKKEPAPSVEKKVEQVSYLFHRSKRWN